MVSTYREFNNESPDYNFFLTQGKAERLAANRVVICTMTEFGLMNNRKMRSYEYSKFIVNLQNASGR
jgi:hypothetical protein